MKHKLLDEHLTSLKKKDNNSPIINIIMTSIFILGTFLPYRYFFREESLDASIWLVDYYWQIPVQITCVALFLSIYHLIFYKPFNLMDLFAKLFMLGFLGSLLLFVYRSFLAPVALISLMLFISSEEAIQTIFVRSNFEIDIIIVLFDLPFIYLFLFTYIENNES